MSVQNRGREVLRYDLMLQRALRSVLREALTEVAERGLPGDHHLYITFRTSAPGVMLADSLRARFPDEMTIVLQHEFWGLDVMEDSFQVTLSFSNRHERLTVPFSAVIAFADPSVRFGLQLEPSAADKAQAESTPAESEAKAPSSKGEAEGDRNDDDDDGGGGGDGRGGDKVVTLDRFRRK